MTENIEKKKEKREKSEREKKREFGIHFMEIENRERKER